MDRVEEVGKRLDDGVIATRKRDRTVGGGLIGVVVLLTWDSASSALLMIRSMMVMMGDGRGNVKRKEVREERAQIVRQCPSSDETLALT